MKILIRTVIENNNSVKWRDNVIHDHCTIISNMLLFQEKTITVTTEHCRPALNQVVKTSQNGKKKKKEMDNSEQ